MGNFTSSRYGGEKAIFLGTSIAVHYRAIGMFVFSFCVVTGDGKRTITVMECSRAGHTLRHVFVSVYHTTQIRPKPATGNGDIDGFKVVCTCGDVQTSSLPEHSQSLAIDHEGWHRARGE